jgi:hypothetical protein
MFGRSALLAAAGNSGDGIVRSGLVLELDAGNTQSYPGSGTTWTDLSGNGNNLELVGSPTYDSADGGSILFNGSTQYATRSTYTPSTVRSISVWLRPSTIINAASASKTLADFGNSWYLSFGAATQSISNEYITVASAGTDQGRTGAVGGGNLAANNWYNVVFNFVAGSPGAYSILVNNVAMPIVSPSAGFGHATLNTAPSRIVLCRFSTANYLDARISRFSTYNVSLTSAQLLQNFNAVRDRYGI